MLLPEIVIEGKNFESIEFFNDSNAIVEEERRDWHFKIFYQNVIPPMRIGPLGKKVVFGEEQFLPSEKERIMES